jgi:hypothetical protein
LRFFASCQSCAARAAGITIHTGWHGSFAAGCHFHAAFRYPFLPACHDWAGSTSFSIRRRSWDFAPFAVFLACGSRRLFPPFIPTCRLPIVQHRCFLRLPAAKSELLPSESGEIRPAAKRSIFGFWVLMPQASQTEPHRAMRPVNPAMGFIVFSQVFRCVHEPFRFLKTLPNPCLLPPRQGRGTPSPCIHGSEQTAPRRNHHGSFTKGNFHPLMGFGTTGKECARAKCRE